MDIKMMISCAIDAMQNAYSPYSNFKVGASLFSPTAGIIKGCNVENASYSVTNCAERTAIFKAVSDGVTDFTAICIVGGMNGVITDYTPPCGVCRQALAEFSVGKDFKIIVAKSITDYKVYNMQEILPDGFYPSHVTV